MHPLLDETVELRPLLKVLVAGGAGFIGSRLVRALVQRGCQVTVLDLHRGRLQSEARPDLEFVGLGGDHRSGGMADAAVVEAAVAGADVVFHLALNWDGGTWRRSQPLAEIFDVNIRGTLNLLEAAAGQKVRQFIFASSEAVYGSGRDQVDEDVVCQPETWEEGDPGPAYGILKLTTERLCLMVEGQRRLPVTVFRIWVAFDDEEALLLSSSLMRKIE